MPQTEPKTSSRLDINLGGGYRAYAPGDTIHGHVFRTAHAVSSKATVEISLHCRSKSRTVIKLGHTGSTYRGRFDLFNAADHTQSLYEGPIHIPRHGGQQAWPFSVTLPTHIDPAALAPGVSQDQSYLSLDAAEDAYKLPSSFIAQRYGFGQGMEGFVEYFLQAELKVTTRGSTNITEAILPIKVTALGLDPPAGGIGLKTSRHTRGLSSYRLIRQMSISGSGSLPPPLQPSAIPNLVFNIQVQTPTVLQIDHPDPIPFLVLAVPERMKSSENVRDTIQKICVTHLSVKIVGVTDVKCQARTTRHDNAETLMNLNAQKALDEAGETIYIPWARDTSEESHTSPGGSAPDETPQPVNVGGKIKLSTRFHVLTPSFETYNVRHTHRLQWKMTVQVAGEDLEMSGEDAITVFATRDSTLRPNTDWIRPPEEDLDPPSFEETQEAEATERRNSRSAVNAVSRLWAGY